MDDIKQPNPDSETEKIGDRTAAPAERRKIGPESEVRGGPEAPEEEE